MLDFEKFFAKYVYFKGLEEIKAAVKETINEHYEHNDTIKTKKLLFSCLEMTSLHSTDNEETIGSMVEKINAMDERMPELPKPAGICVYPALVETVKDLLTEDILISTVVGFPSGQTFPEVKIAEAALAVKAGATEIDMVMNVGKFLQGNYSDVYDEIEEVKAVCGYDVILKVIIEADLLRTPQNIYKASMLAMEAGADIIKTSTGKESVSNLAAAYVMCEAIRDLTSDAGGKKGLKVAGGIKTTEDALMYATIAEEILGEDFVCPETFRIGASSLADSLAGDILKEPVKYFT